jgi:periplasmic protein CpxP/Spy
MRLVCSEISNAFQQVLSKKESVMTKFAGKNFKRTAAMLLCSVSLVLPALAQTGATNSGAPDQTQGPPPPPNGGGGGRGGRMGNPEQRLERMQKELNLTPDQSTKVKSILEDGRAKMMALRNDSSASQDDRRAKMMDLMKTENMNIKAVLDDTQKAKFEAMEQQMRGRRGRGGNGGDAPPPSPPPPPASPNQ